MEHHSAGVKASVGNISGIPFSRVEYSNHEFEPHFHHHWVIMNVRSGINLGQKDRSAYAIDKSSMLILQPGTVHTGSSWEGKKLVYDAIYPDCHALNSIAAKFHIQLNGGFKFSAHLFTNPELILSFNELFRCITGVNDALENDSMLCGFFSALAREAGGPPLKPPGKKESAVVSRVARFISEHYANNDISLSQISEAAQVSPYYLIRLFKRSCGQTPFEFLRNYRVERSKELMRSDDSLTEIALATGFYDQSHFIRSFRAVTGWSPGLYRKAIL